MFILTNAEILDSKIEDLRAQPCKDDFIDKLALSKHNVMEILESRRYGAAIKDYWINFFARLPQSASDTMKLVGYSGSLITLREMCGGKVRLKDMSHYNPHVRTSDYIDRVTYNGHAMREYMNRDIEARMIARYSYFNFKSASCVAIINICYISYIVAQRSYSGKT